MQVSETIPIGIEFYRCPDGNILNPGRAGEYLLTSPDTTLAYHVFLNREGAKIE